MLKTKLLIGGSSPEYCLNRLKREKIRIFRAEKTEKNKILITLSQKDAEKVFAIYPRIWYNDEKDSPYVVLKEQKTGFSKTVSLLKKRVGLWLGILAFFCIVSVSDSFIFDVRMTGDTTYRTEAIRLVREVGLSKGDRDSLKKRTTLERALTKLDKVSFASVKKDGKILYLNVRLSPFSDKDTKTGALRSAYVGTVEEIVVLRGTKGVFVGEQVKIGQPLIYDYILFGNEGEEQKAKTVAVGFCKIAVESEWKIEAENEKEAVKKALFLAGDGENEAVKTEQKDGKYVVKIRSVRLQTINYSHT